MQIFRVSVVVVPRLGAELCGGRSDRTAGGRAHGRGARRRLALLRGDASGVEAANVDDAGFEGVTVPHTWNALDGQDGGDDYFRGVG